MIRSMLCGGAAAFLLASGAFAQDAPEAHSPADAAVSDIITTPDPEAERANGEWARRILAGEPSAEARADAAPARGCAPNGDRKPHGVVWGSVGTGGYKSGGAVVTQQVGDCASVTVGYEQTHMGGANGGRRRR